MGYDFGDKSTQVIPEGGTMQQHNGATRQALVPTTLDHFDYWLLHEFVKLYKDVQIVRKDMIGAPPGGDSSRVLPHVEGRMTSSGVRVFAYRGHEYHARYRFQRPLNDASASITDEFGTGAEILAIQRQPNGLQVFFRDFKPGWLEEVFIKWLRFAYPTAEFVTGIDPSDPPKARMMSKKGKSGRPRLACNEWAREEFDRLKEEAKKAGTTYDVAEFCDDYLPVYERLHKEEYERRHNTVAGYVPLEDPKRSLELAVTRTTKRKNAAGKK
jgi:hypothetical protein